jgi:hypothetical protein
MANLSSRRALKAATTAIKIAARLEHPMKQALEDAETYVPFFIRAIDPYSSVGIELRKGDAILRRQQSPLITNTGHQIITILCVLLKKSGTERIRSECVNHVKRTSEKLDKEKINQTFHL